MKVLILSPTCPPELTGNAVTAKRLYSGLGAKGVEVGLLRSDLEDLDSQVSALKPDIIHALHAKKSGEVAMEMSERYKIPYLVTITGTDLYIDLCQSGSRDVPIVLDKAAAVIVCSELTKDRLLSALPGLSARLKVIKKSIPFDTPPETHSSTATGTAFLLPSGIRPVKDPSFAIKPLEMLRKKYPELSLTVAGPRLDKGEWASFCTKSAGRDWIRYLTVSHDAMPGLYMNADVVLNTSLSEGLSNAVLEAMHFGRAVLVSDCEGNRAAISSGIEGLLYRTGDEGDFIEKARKLLSNPALRMELGKRATEKIRREYRLDTEIEAHIGLYRGLLE